MSDTKTPLASPYADHSLSNYEVNRYSRQIIIAEFGVKGKGLVLVIGHECARRSGETVALECADRRSRWTRLSGGDIFG
jgi:hypothetical protein